jgi:hypothetical protein
MIEFLLAVQICNNMDGDCTWQKKARYPTEEKCVANGLAIDPAVVRFKCVQIERRAGPDQRTPIPRPRPAFAPEMKP